MNSTIDREHKKAKLIQSVLKGLKGRLKHNYSKDYPKVAEIAIIKYESLDPKKELRNQKY